MRRMIAVTDRPRIGISACLLGERVRYDGRDKRDAWLVDVLGRDVEWVSVCPEVEAGFGTPREPMALARDADHGVVLMTTRVRPELTATLREFSERRVEELAATMRTPGADCELAAGFLLAERVIRSADDLGTVAHCTDPSSEHRENIVN